MLTTPLAARLVAARGLPDLSILWFTLLGGGFVYLSAKLVRDGSKKAARRLYYYSNAYLALLFLAMVIDYSALYF